MAKCYKRDVNRLRESPALDIILLREQRGVCVTYSDPRIPRPRLNGHSLTSVEMSEAVAEAGCVAIVTDHSAFDYASLVDKANLIVDTRNALNGHDSDKIVPL